MQAIDKEGPSNEDPPMRTDRTQSRNPIPLSSDLELRPRGTEPVGMRRALAPSILQWIDSAVDARQRLLHLADEAASRNDCERELHFIVKVAHLSLDLLKLSQASAEECT